MSNPFTKIIKSVTRSVFSYHCTTQWLLFCHGLCVSCIQSCQQTSSWKVKPHFNMQLWL